MENPELFDESVAILVQAYLNNTLVKGNCAACAAGNIIAARNNIKLTRHPNGYLTWGEDHFYPSAYNGGWYDIFSTEQDLSHEGIELIKSSGYTFVQIYDIEEAFERGGKGSTMEELMFNGLMAVVDVLQQIHEATPEEAQKAKALFVN